MEHHEEFERRYPHDCWFKHPGDERYFYTKTSEWVDAVPEGCEHLIVNKPNEEAFVSNLRAYNIPPYHRIQKSTILSRMTVEQRNAAYALLDGDKMLRWTAPDKPQVNADDPDLLAIGDALGLSEEEKAELLAPE